MSTTQVTYHAKGVFFTETGATKVREFLETQDADLSLAGLRVVLPRRRGRAGLCRLGTASLLP